MARLGLLGGTFNPPHVGHLICASEACEQLGLDRILVVPVHTPPHKEAVGDPGPAARLELCRLAIADDPRLEVSDVEVRRGGPSFTVDTLRAIHAERPGDELTFIVGGDQAQGFPTWREPRAILGLARLAVAERSGVVRADIVGRLAPLGAPDRVVFFDMPRIDVSSSSVRRRIADGRSARYLVPDAVAAYIARRGLYREPVAAPSKGTA